MSVFFIKGNRFIKYDRIREPNLFIEFGVSFEPHRTETTNLAMEFGFDFEYGPIGLKRSPLPKCRLVTELSLVGKCHLLAEFRLSLKIRRSSKVETILKPRAILKKTVSVKVECGQAMK